MKLKNWEEEERMDADLESEEWEPISTEMDEESLGSESMQGEDAETGGPDGRLREPDSEEDQRWEETELDFKPGVSYRWKKFNLDSEPDDGDWRGEEWAEPDSGQRAERRGKPERQNPKGVYPGQGKKGAAESGGKEAAGTSGRGQKTRIIEEEGEEGWEEELPPLKPWTKVLIFIGLAVVAAIICAILWRFAHPERPDGSEGQHISSPASESPGDASEEAPKLDLEGPEEGQPGESLSGLTPEGTDPDSGTGGTGSEPGDASGADAESGVGGSGSGAGNGSGAPSGTGAGDSGPGAGEGTGTPAGADTEPGAGTGGESPSSEPGGQEPVAGAEGMTFQAVQESVTPKDVVNLRKVPNTADADSIVTQARNGETLSRIGVNPDTGWSQIDYNGQTLYAVSQYLTTDLSYRPAVQPADPNRVSTVSGRIIIFENCDDWISPKEYVNLRTEPSTTEGDATVSCQLNYGEKVHRTGYSTDSGWSRVEYNGQVLYVVTSLMYVVPAE